MTKKKKYNSYTGRLRRSFPFTIVLGIITVGNISNTTANKENFFPNYQPPRAQYIASRRLFQQLDASTRGVQKWMWAMSNPFIPQSKFQQLSIVLNIFLNEYAFFTNLFFKTSPGVHPGENNQSSHQPPNSPVISKAPPTPTTTNLNASLLRTKDKDQVKYGHHDADYGSAPPSCCTVFWNRLVDKVWSHSLLKLCYKELIVFIILYNTLSIIYRHVLIDDRPKAE